MFIIVFNTFNTLILDSPFKNMLTGLYCSHLQLLLVCEFLSSVFSKQKACSVVLRSGDCPKTFFQYALGQYLLQPNIKPKHVLMQTFWLIMSISCFAPSKVTLPPTYLTDHVQSFRLRCSILSPYFSLPIILYKLISDSSVYFFPALCRPFQMFSDKVKKKCLPVVECNQQFEHCYNVSS